MALSAGGPDNLSLSTQGQRVLRPAVTDVRNGTDRGDGVLGTLNVAGGTYADAAFVYVGVDRGDGVLGTMLTPPANPPVESDADDQFAASNDDLFLQFGVSGMYTSDSVGAAIMPWKNGLPGACFDEFSDGVGGGARGESRGRSATLALRIAAEDPGDDEITYTIYPVPDVDTWQLVDADGVLTGPVWRVKVIGEILGGVATLTLGEETTQKARGVDRREW